MKAKRKRRANTAAPPAPAVKRSKRKWARPGGLVTTEEACAILEVSHAGLDHAVREGALTPAKYGPRNQHLFLFDEVDTRARLLGTTPEYAALKTFWERVDRKGPDECWPWTGFRSRQGYGTSIAGTCQKFTGETLAHRISYALNIGVIPEGAFICHTCDTPACVNPKHLYAGNSTTNIADMIRRDRNAYGERCPQAKLTAEQVSEARKLRRTEKLSIVVLAERFGVERKTMSNALVGKTWAHVSGVVTKDESRAAARESYRRGGRTHRKLSRSVMNEIRVSDHSLKRLAAEHGVDKSTIIRVKNDSDWVLPESTSWRRPDERACIPAQARAELILFVDGALRGRSPSSSVYQALRQLKTADSDPQLVRLSEMLVPETTRIKKYNLTAVRWKTDHAFCGRNFGNLKWKAKKRPGAYWFWAEVGIYVERQRTHGNAQKVFSDPEWQKKAGVDSEGRHPLVEWFKATYMKRGEEECATKVTNC